MKENYTTVYNPVSKKEEKNWMNGKSFKDPPQLNVTVHAHFQFDASKMLKKVVTGQQPSGKEQKKPAGKSHNSLA